MSFTDDELNRLLDRVPKLESFQDRLAELESIREGHEAARASTARTMSTSTPWASTGHGTTAAPAVSRHERNRQRLDVLEQLEEALNGMADAWSAYREARTRLLTNEAWRDEKLNVLRQVRDLSLVYVESPVASLPQLPGRASGGEEPQSNRGLTISIPSDERHIEDLAEAVRLEKAELQKLVTRYDGGPNRGGRSTPEAVDRHYVRAVCQCIGVLGPLPEGEWLPALDGVVQVVLPKIGRDRRKKILRALKNDLPNLMF